MSISAVEGSTHLGMRHNLFCAWSLTIVRSLHVHVTTVMLTKCSCLLAGLPALPVKESASTLRMDIRALMAWTDRHKPVSIERLHRPPACSLPHVLSELTNDCSSASLYVQLHACSLCLLTGCTSLCVLNHFSQLSFKGSQEHESCTS